MPRNQNALAIVNAAFVLRLNNKKVITYISVVYGNISPSFIHACYTEAYLMGKTINNEVLQESLAILNDEIRPKENLPEESPEARKLALGLYYKVCIISEVAINLAHTNFKNRTLKFRIGSCK